MYYNARYYNPQTGIFIQADIVDDGQNKYQYVAGNPVNRTDPSGNMMSVDEGGGGGSISKKSKDEGRFIGGLSPKAPFKMGILDGINNYFPAEDVDHIRVAMMEYSMTDWPIHHPEVDETAGRGNRRFTGYYAGYILYPEEGSYEIVDTIYIGMYWYLDYLRDLDQNLASNYNLYYTKARRTTIHEITHALLYSNNYKLQNQFNDLASQKYVVNNESGRLQPKDDSSEKLYPYPEIYPLKNYDELAADLAVIYTGNAKYGSEFHLTNSPEKLKREWPDMYKWIQENLFHGKQFIDDEE